LGRGGAAVDVVSDLLGAVARAIVLAGHLLNSLVRNSEIRRERLFSRYQHDTNKNANKSDGWDRTRLMYAEVPIFQGFPSTARTVADALERA
jgi:hypothetical protein